MKINVLKKGLILLLIFILINIPIKVKAFSFDSIIEGGKSFIDSGSEDTGISESELQGLSKSISGILLTIALGITLISIVVMAINFMTQSIDDKAKIKEAMVPWLIGVIISFGAFGIWQITINIFQNFG